MTTNRQAQIKVANHFDSAATIELSHRSGRGGVVESTTWTSVAAGAVGEPAMTVHYQTGFGSPWDYWHVSISVEGGTASAGRSENDGFKECYLKDVDENGLHTFDVSPTGGFKLNMVSEGCSTGLKKLN